MRKLNLLIDCTKKEPIIFLICPIFDTFSMDIARMSVKSSRHARNLYNFVIIFGTSWKFEPTRGGGATESQVFEIPKFFQKWYLRASLLWVCSTWRRRWWHQVMIGKINCRLRAVVDVCQYLISRSVWCRHDGTSSNEPCQHLNVIHFLSQAEHTSSLHYQNWTIATGVSDFWIFGDICCLNDGVRHGIERC